MDKKTKDLREGFIPLNDLTRNYLIEECKPYNASKSWDFPKNVVAILTPKDLRRLISKTLNKEENFLKEEILKLITQKIPKTRIAKILNISRQTLYRMLEDKNCNISPSKQQVKDTKKMGVHTIA